MRLSIITALLFFLTPTIAAEQKEKAVPVAIQEIERSLEAFSANNGGAAIIIEVEGEVVLRKGYGLADRKNNRAFTTDTVAQIGSLTKQFTATAILTLAAKGDIDLDAIVVQYLPTSPEPLRSVTLHQLLTHTAGLPEYCGDDFVPISLDAMLNDCLSAPLLFEPGQSYAYSNPGYSIPAAIVEAVSGEMLDDYLKHELLLPNGLKKTGYKFADDTLSFARGYLDNNDKGVISERIAQLGQDWWNLKGNGGMQASTEDMYLWYRVLNGAGSLPPNVITQLSTPHTEWNEGVAEGYGWFFRDDGKGRVRQMSHSGSDGTFFSYYWNRPEDQVFMYFVGNSGEEPVLEELRNILKILRKYYIAN